MEDKFEKELAALINKHGLEKKLGDTQDELERVKETGTIHLSMLTFNQPLQPVLLTVDLPTE